ncbi:copper chaperone PCu(A)C [Corynebacterium alimapuense]|nr:copper chaperone PCu(A)C [Corynebacterium alimapuense]
MKSMSYIAIAVASLPALLLAGCSSDSADSAAATSEVASSGEIALSMENGYCRAKAKSPADAEFNSMETMTACFGELVNDGDQDINIASFTVTNLPDETHYELHQTIDGVMSEKDGGFEIAAGAYKTLEPGGDHLMVMEIYEEIPAGGDLDLVLTLSEGSTVEFSLPVREQAAGNEDYSDLG